MAKYTKVTLTRTGVTYWKQLTNTTDVTTKTIFYVYIEDSMFIARRTRNKRADWWFLGDNHVKNSSNLNKRSEDKS